MNYSFDHKHPKCVMAAAASSLRYFSEICLSYSPSRSAHGMVWH